MIKNRWKFCQKRVEKSLDRKQVKTQISDDPFMVFDGFLVSKLMKNQPEIHENRDEEEISKKQIIFRSKIPKLGAIFGPKMEEESMQNRGRKSITEKSG